MYSNTPIMTDRFYLNLSMEPPSRTPMGEEEYLKGILEMFEEKFI